MTRDGAPSGSDLPPGLRYRAFISYSHRDKDAARWLHRTLETFQLPKELVGTATPHGPAPRRLTPIFRDQDELPASGDLGTELRAAIAGSLFLVVICSPASAASPWVNEEIITFKRVHGEGRILALIVGGEPYASGKPGQEAQECFPAALRFRLGPDGAISQDPAEPLAADLRPEKDGRRLATLKLVAGLAGVRLDDIAQREAQRRIRRLVIISSASVAGMILAGGLAIYANAQRIEAERQSAEARRQTAIAKHELAASRAASDFLVGTFQLANPATDNPRTVTALTILERGARRATTELASQPAIQSRLLATVGAAYNNLGLAQDVVALLTQALPSLRTAGTDGGRARLQLANAYVSLGRLPEATAEVDAVERVATQDDSQSVDTRALSEVIRSKIELANGNPKGGLAALDKALVLYRKGADTQPKSLAVALNMKGFLLSDDGQFAQADAALTESLAIYRREVGDQDLLTGQAWLGLALNDLAAGQLAKAETHVGTALSIMRRVLDPDNPILADAISSQGQILQAAKKLPAAAASLKEAIAIYKKAYKRPFYQTGITLVYLALVESDQGKTGEALAHLAEAKQVYDISYGKLHPNHGDLLVNRATVLAHAGRLREAVHDCAAGLEILKQTLGPDAAFTRANIAICHKLVG